MFQVKAYWDAEARLWHGASNELPELSVQAATMEDLIVDVRERILDLMPPIDQWRTCREPISISFIASRAERVERRH